MIKSVRLNYEVQCADTRQFKKVDTFNDEILKQNLFPDGFDPGSPKIFMEESNEQH